MALNITDIPRDRILSPVSFVGFSVTAVDMAIIYEFLFYPAAVIQITRLKQNMSHTFEFLVCFSSLFKCGDMDLAVPLVEVL